jgi:SHS2 domain-containing protein
VRRTILAQAPDRPALLAQWLEELVFLGVSEGFVARTLESLELHPNGLCAEVAGVVGHPPPFVKAVTYHRLAFESRDRGYVARVVLDV